MGWTVELAMVKNLLVSGQALQVCIPFFVFIGRVPTKVSDGVGASLLVMLPLLKLPTQSLFEQQDIVNDS